MRIVKLAEKAMINAAFPEKALRPSYGISLSDGGIRRWNLRASLLSNLWQILYPHQPVLAGECQRLICALRLGHAKDAMVASVVNFYMVAVFDSQSPGEYRIEVILCANCAGCSEISGPPI